MAVSEKSRKIGVHVDFGGIPNFWTNPKILKFPVGIFRAYSGHIHLNFLDNPIHVDSYG